MKKPDFLKCWNKLLHWSGWRAAGKFCAAFGKRIVAWSGWKCIFGLPFPMVLLMSAACGAGLVWVFVHGLEMQIPAYVLYALSAYSLCALGIGLPGGIGSAKNWLARHPKLISLLANEELHFKLELYFEQFLNFSYGIFKIASGVILGSAWIGCDGIYNLAQALIQLFQILRRRKAGTLQKQWRSYRFCGVLILLMHLTLTEIVFQMVNWNRAEESGEIMIIATATFVFYKFASRLLELAKDRKHIHPIDSSVRMLELAQAIFAVFSLQASMFHVYGTGAGWEQLMNILTGSVVCLLIAAMGIYMIRRGNREIRKIQEDEHGKQAIL